MGILSKRGLLFKGLSVISPCLEIYFEDDSSWLLYLRKMSQDEWTSWEYISGPGLLVTDFSRYLLVLKRVSRRLPRDYIIFETSCKTRRCRKKMYQDEEYSSKNSSRLEICSEEDSSRLCFHWKISRDEKMSWKDVLRPLQKNLVNEKSSSNDFSRPGIIIKRFIGSGSTFRKIYQEEDLSSEYLSRRVVTSFKIFCRQRIVVERIIKTVGCHHIFSRRGNVVERFLQKRICYREVHQDEKFSSKKFWGRISFLEIEIIFKTNNLNRKYSTRRGDN